MGKHARILRLRELNVNEKTADILLLKVALIGLLTKIQYLG